MMTEAESLLDATTLRRLIRGVPQSRLLDSEDAVHDVLVRVLTARGSVDAFPTVQDLSAYVLTGARNRLRDAADRAATYERLEPWKLEALTPGWGENVEARAAGQMIRRAFSVLTAEESDALFYEAVEGMTREEIAAKLEVGKNRPKELIDSAIRKVRRALGITHPVTQDAEASMRQFASECAREAWTYAHNPNGYFGSSGDERSARQRWLEALRWVFPQADRSATAHSMALKLLNGVVCGQAHGVGHGVECVRGGLHRCTEAPFADELQHYVASALRNLQRWPNATMQSMMLQRAATLHLHYGGGDPLEDLQQIADMASLRRDADASRAVNTWFQDFEHPELRRAAAVLSKALDCPAEPATRWWSLAWLTHVYIAMGEPNLAAETAREFDALPPNYRLQYTQGSRTDLWAGHIALLQGDWERAAPLFESAYSKQRTLSSLAWWALAALRAHGRAEGLRLVREAIAEMADELDSSADAFYAVARCCQELGYPRLAARYAQEAVRLYRGYAEKVRFLSGLYEPQLHAAALILYAKAVMRTRAGAAFGALRSARCVLRRHRLPGADRIDCIVGSFLAAASKTFAGGTQSRIARRIFINGVAALYAQWYRSRNEPRADVDLYRLRRRMCRLKESLTWEEPEWARHTLL